ncbi:MAG: dienelactone hydrolase family protein [Anaerolineae bacterium]|nr:dienelactone hydrolase family protein [Anaerolineae bacterium]MDW8298934.1 dienelactone hydrolase family protein [Anaerolineae bacterium]
MDERAIREGLYETPFIQHRITGGYIRIIDGTQGLPAFWAHPQIGGTFPGLVLIHGERGLNNQIRMRVRRFAELGYYVIAPELFGATFNTNDLATRRAALRKGGDSAVLSALQVLRTHNRVNGRLGVVGWGAGGEVALRVALKQPELRAAVIFGGNPQPYLSELHSDQAAILAFYGDDDPEVPPATLNQMWKELAQSKARWQMIIYPNVANDFKDEESPRYHPYYAADAWRRCTEFLHELLEPPAPTVSLKASDQA